MDPVWDSSPFYIKTVLSQTGTKVTRVGAATERKSDRSHVNPWKEMYVNPWKEMYEDRYKLIPVWVRPGLM